MIANRVRFTVLFLACVLGIHPAFTQDSHYWNRNYGSNSTLLGGAVIGANADLGSIYYNPAALAFRDSIRVSFSSSVYDVNYLKQQNVLADGMDASSLTVSTYPFTFIPSFKINDRTNLGFIFLTRMESEVDLHELDSGSYDIFSDGGSYPFVGVADYHNDMNERWYGGAVSHLLNSNSSVGVSLFIAYRWHEMISSYNASVVLPPASGGLINRYLVTDISRFVHYYNYKAIFKMGYYYDDPQFSFGISATLPSISLLGSGGSSARYYVSTLPDSSTSEELVDVLVFDEQNDMKAKHKYPATIGIGYTRKLTNWKLYASAEYFFPIQTYSIMEPVQQPNIRPAEWFNVNTNDLIGVETGARSILNLGFGFNYQMSEKKNLLGSITTDFNSLPSDAAFIGNNVTVSSWNLFHVSTGFSFRVLRFDLLVGLRYSVGKSAGHRQLVDMRTPRNDNLLIGDLDMNVDQSYRSLSFLFGFNL